MAECIFCRIAAGEVPSTMVHEDEEIVAFRDLSPQAPTHILIIPRKHVPSVTDLEAGEDAVTGRLVRVAGEIAAKEGISEPGYRLVVNCGKDAGQAVGHLHVHLLGGRRMGWPPG
jgi:histidine triad (HIT) family protein